MEQLIEILTALLRRDTRKPAQPRALKVELAGAPPCVTALAEALASSQYSVDLGEFHLSTTSGPVVTLATALEMAEEAGFDDLAGHLASAGPGGAPFEVASTLALCPDGGGMSELGVVWSGGAVHLVIVEMEDPTPDNLIALLSTPEAFFERLDRSNRGRKGKDLELLRAKLGLAVAEPAPPVSALRVWDGAPPPHPFAEARAQFPQGSVLQSPASPSGQVVVARRVSHGPPPLPLQLAVRTQGTSRDLEGPGSNDVYALCSVPGRERVLVCCGIPGPLVEIDLASGARRELLPRVGWSCGFLDAEHLVVFADNKALEVYRWSDAALEAPVARVPVDINNIFVAHGLVFAKTKDYQTPSFQLLRWNGAGLDDLGVHPVELKGFALHGASEQAGHKLVAAVDTKFNVSWFAVTPP